MLDSETLNHFLPQGDREELLASYNALVRMPIWVGS
ncbi:hypothetical protein MGMO_8c00200 [Methyloglobulus morosus KoM1]|uniref:Uncharacterized protein n=1 Tax=Methyloglobulus morosus KoM1 TaxID=1116472 RepID=V5CAP0_9GAMM|nr:hypothetical protein MGMO_8c00200 [Methyloglobulus morosus KoM1]